MKGFLFDYGATLDTRGEHWSKVIWRAYKKIGVDATWEQYYEAYAATERRLGKGDVILPTDTFKDTLRKKIKLQMEFLNGDDNLNCIEDIVNRIYEDTKEVTEESRQVLQSIKGKYSCPMVLVSNFYGNIRTVLEEFRLDGFFDEVIESAEVGIRKPDIRIWQMAIDALNRHSPTTLQPSDITVVGDSMEKDLLPAQALGCNTVHASKIKELKD